MNWIFKPGPKLKFEELGQKAIASFEQKRNFTGKEGENVLILEKTEKDWMFSSQYQISDIEIIDTDAVSKKFTISLGLVKKFTEGKLLEDYIYSLRRITNFSKPDIHFRGKYNRLYDAEFDAIENDKLHLKRTLLGTIFHAMHSDHQKAFIAFLAAESPQLFTGSYDLDKAMDLLLTYLYFAIIHPAEYLKESAQILNSLLPDDYALIGFGEDSEIFKSKKMNMVKPQVGIIEEHLKELPTPKLNQDKYNNLLSIETDRKLRTLFKNAPLPLTLKTSKS